MDEHQQQQEQQQDDVEKANETGYFLKISSDITSFPSIDDRLEHTLKTPQVIDINALGEEYNISERSIELKLNDFYKNAYIKSWSGENFTRCNNDCDLESVHCHDHCAHTSLTCHRHCFTKNSIMCHEHCRNIKGTNCHEHCKRNHTKECHDHCIDLISEICHNHCKNKHTKECHDHCEPTPNIVCHPHCQNQQSEACHSHCKNIKTTECHAHCKLFISTECHPHCERIVTQKCHSHCSSIKTMDCHPHCDASIPIEEHPHHPDCISTSSISDINLSSRPFEILFKLRKQSGKSFDNCVPRLLSPMESIQCGMPIPWHRLKHIRNSDEMIKAQEEELHSMKIPGKRGDYSVLVEAVYDFSVKYNVGIKHNKNGDYGVRFYCTCNNMSTTEKSKSYLRGCPVYFSFSLRNGFWEANPEKTNLVHNDKCTSNMLHTGWFIRIIERYRKLIMPYVEDDATCPDTRNNIMKDLHRVLGPEFKDEIEETKKGVYDKVNTMKNRITKESKIDAMRKNPFSKSFTDLLREL